MFMLFPYTKIFRNKKNCLAITVDYFWNITWIWQYSIQLLLRALTVIESLKTQELKMYQTPPFSNGDPLHLLFFSFNTTCMRNLCWCRARRWLHSKSWINPTRMSRLPCLGRRTRRLFPPRSQRGLRQNDSCTRPTTTTTTTRKIKKQTRRTIRYCRPPSKECSCRCR